MCLYKYTYIACVYIYIYIHIYHVCITYWFPGNTVSTPTARLRRLHGYLASWVPSPPGKHTCKNFALQTHRKTVCGRTILGTHWAKYRYPFSRRRHFTIIYCNIMIYRYISLSLSLSLYIYIYNTPTYAIV